MHPHGPRSGPDGFVLAPAPDATRMVDLAADHQCAFWASTRG